MSCGHSASAVYVGDTGEPAALVARQARRATARARSAAASRAMAISPARSTRGTRRSNAAINCSNSRMTSVICLATRTGAAAARARTAVGRRSRPRHRRHSANRYSDRRFAPSSSPYGTDTRDRQVFAVAGQRRIRWSPWDPHAKGFGEVGPERPMAQKSRSQQYTRHRDAAAAGFQSERQLGARRWRRIPPTRTPASTPKPSPHVPATAMRRGLTRRCGDPTGSRI